MKLISAIVASVTLSILIYGFTPTYEVVYIKPAVATSTPKTFSVEFDRLATKYKITTKEKTLLLNIINCESKMYGGSVNHNKDKDGKIWSKDSYDWQINNYYHEATMKKLGLDYNDRWDSLEYGFILYKQQGVKPWSASAKCWN